MGIAFLGIFGSSLVIGHAFSEIVDIKVYKTESFKGTYMIFTDNGVFKDVDDWRFLKRNSFDLYSKLTQNIREDKPVSVMVTGFRVPMMSMHKNIISIEH